MEVYEVGGGGSRGLADGNGAVTADSFANCDFEDEGIGGKPSQGFQINAGVFQYNREF